MLVEVRLLRRHRPRAARGVRVHRLRRDDLEPTKGMARRLALRTAMLTRRITPAFAHGF